jgi:hypothetical protein
VTGQWFSPGTLVSSTMTNKTDSHNITEILLSRIGTHNFSEMICIYCNAITQIFNEIKTFSPKKAEEEVLSLI